MGDLNKIMQKKQVINAQNVKQKQCELMNELQPLSDLLQVFESNDLKDLKQKIYKNPKNTKYATKIEQISKKRKRSEIEVENEMNPQKKKQKQQNNEEKQLISLPIINAQYPQNAIFAPFIPPPLTSSNVNLRPPPPPPTTAMNQNENDLNVADGIDLLLNAAEDLEMKK